MAYGARLESVLGASPRGFESPILRSTSPGSVEIPGFFLCLQRFWAVGIETDICRLIPLRGGKNAPNTPPPFLKIGYLEEIPSRDREGYSA